MQVLEKILEEIEEASFQEDTPVYVGDMEVDGYVRESVVKEIIRSHMDGISKTTDVQEVEGIDVDNAIRILKDMQSPKIDYAEMVGAPAFCYGKRYVFQDPEDYAIETALAALNEKKERDARRAKDTNVPSNDGWIPVEERLPEKQNKLYYDICIVTLENGEVCLGVYRNAENEWWTKGNAGREVYTNKRDVVAWQPLPKPYKPKKVTAAGMEHIMSRFTKVE